MKGNELILFVCKKIAVTITLFLTFFTVASWSQNVYTDYRDLLNAALIAIALTMLFTGLFHPKASTEIYSWWLFGKVKFRHLAIYSSIMFFLVLIFPLGSNIFPDVMHMVATGLAILGIFLIIAGWYKTWSKYWWRFMIAMVVSVSLLIVAFLPQIEVPWQVGHGEFSILATALVFLEKI